ncbi:MAG TPA: PDZ domain-containing protein [Thermoanaerobaculia bacterium]|nr:PDZ domain-containing protein [Thermoanaerobaculia bacterium]
MNRILTTVLTLVIATAAVADQPVRRTATNTVIVRDGKLITSNGDNRFLIETLIGSRAFLGVSLMNLSPDLREHFGAPKDAGVMVESVADDSPAEKAGLRVGDIVLSVDGKDVKSSVDLRLALKDKKEGDSVRIDYLRGKSRQTVVASVKERDTPRLMQLEDLPTIVGTPEFRARVERLGGDCGDLQVRIKELETRLKDLEKKLQK